MGEGGNGWHGWAVGRGAFPALCVPPWPTGIACNCTENTNLSLRNRTHTSESEVSQLRGKRTGGTKSHCLTGVASPHYLVTAPYLPLE